MRLKTGEPGDAAGRGWNMITGETSGAVVPAVTEAFHLPTRGMSITSNITRNTYRMEAQIGEGAFGVVFGCTDVWNNELVAKVLKPMPGRPQGELESHAADEINKLLHVQHPNITHVFDAFTFNGACYIISERCDGTLATLLTGPNFVGRFWVPPIARCLLQAVHFAHVQGLVHCDIHLGNVFFRFIRDEKALRANC
jgi:serine/threonine protein kinase